MPADSAARNGGDAVLVEVHGRVMTITMNRPRVRNAINRAMSVGVAQAIDEYESRPELRVAILTGAGGNFSSGADLKAYLAGEDLRVGSRGMLGLLRQRPRKPLIAAVEGYAVGGGFEAVLVCDLVVAAQDARFGLPEVRRGLAATGGGLIRLPRLLPERIAMELALTGAPIDAQRLAAYGLVNRLTPAGDALAGAELLAEEILAGAPRSIEISKQVILEQRQLSEAEAFDLQDRYAAGLSSSPDAIEGAAAFAQKRPPVWSTPPAPVDG